MALKDNGLAFRITRLVHEVRQPLNILRLSSGNVRNRLVLNNPKIEIAPLIAKLDRMDAQVDRAAQLLDEIANLLRARTSGNDAAKTEEQNRSPRLRLVLVEDEPHALEAMAELLEFDGYEIAACINAQQALAAFSEWPDACLITDVLLTDTDGIELAQRISRTFNPARIILMSGLVPGENDCEDAWVYLQKPVNFSQLIEAIGEN